MEGCDSCQRIQGLKQSQSSKSSPLLRRNSNLASQCVRILLMLAFVRGVSCKEQEKMPDLNTIPTPPMFTHEPNDPVVYYMLDGTQEASGTNRNLKERTFMCTASGHPDVTYFWEKDGKPFDLSQQRDRITQLEDEGTFIFSKLQTEDEGTYQCFARNENGTAIDHPIEFKRAWILRFEKVEPVIVDVELQDPFKRSCVAPDSVPDPRVYWIFMGKDEREKFSTINSTYISSDEDGNIYFHSVKEDDFQPGKFYTCTAENTQLQDYKFGNQFQLSVKKNKRRKLADYVPPQEQFISKDVIAVKGRSVQLHCFFAGYPPPKPQWFKGDIMVQGEKGRIEFPNYGKSLEIKNVSSGDGGDYECRYKNAPRLNRIINVQVEAAPYWPADPPASVNSSSGQSVTYICGAVGKPKPKITFFKNGEEMKPSLGAGKFEIVGNRLVIHDLEKGENGRGDNAVYQCKAENKHGYQWANFYLNILQFPPYLLDREPVIDAVLTKPLTLWCKFFGSPLPNVTWHGPQLSGSTNHQKKIDDKGVARITIPEVTRDVAGDYSCHAVNDFGNTEGFIKVNVREATRIVERPKNVTNVAGQPVALECHATSDPKLAVTYTWLMDGEPLPQDLINNGHYRIDSDNTLHIKRPKKFDSAAYTCNASTALDHVSTTAVLLIKDVPAPVTSSYIVCEGEKRTVAVNFMHVENENVAAHVQEFWVQYQIDPETEGGAWRTHNTPVKEPWGSALTRHDETNLREIAAAVTVPLNPFGKYTFRVLARNEVGDSSPVEASETCDTPPAVPEVNPTDVRAEGNTDDNLVVYWEPMPREEWNGPDFHYVVKYRKKDEDGDGDADGDGEQDEWEEVKVEDPYADHTVIDGAGTFQPYETQVQAVNALGPSTVAPETVDGYSGQGIPSVTPSGFRVVSKSGTSCTFAWNPVNQSQVNGELKGYKVVHWYEDARRKRSPGVRKEVEFSPDVSRGTVDNMKPNRQNKAQIMVFNGANDGPPSDTITIDMPEWVPTAVRQLHAYPVAYDIVGLLWKNPREMNGELDHYVISYCPILNKNQDGTVKVDENNCPDSTYVDADTRYFYVEGLSELTDYQFTVVGVTGAGKGSPNSVDAKTLPENLPAERHKMLEAAGVGTEPPVAPTLEEAGIGEDHLNVTWHPGLIDEENPLPVGDSHYFKYRKHDTEEWQEAHPIERNFTVMIDGLEPGTTYEVVAVSVAKDKDGNSHETASPPYFYTTAGAGVDRGSIWWLILIIILIVLILIILCIVCVIVRSRGAKYPVSEKEKEQGREPMLSKEEKGFGEYARPENDEKRSLTGSKPESETDSMAEYGDGDVGRFTEDGSFIGIYGPNKMLVSSTQPAAGGGRGQSNVSTFV